MAGGQFHTDEAALAFVFVVSLEQAADFVRLHAHDWVFLLVEIRAPVVDLGADQVFVELFAIALKGLLGNELKKADLLRRAGKELALYNPAKFLALFVGRETVGRIGVLYHFELPSSEAQNKKDEALLLTEFQRNLPLRTVSRIAGIPVLALADQDTNGYLGR